MNESGPNGPAKAAGDDALGRLIARAGRRPEPPESIEAQVRAAVFEEWQRVSDRRRRRSYMIVAVAATAAFAAFGLVVLREMPEPPAPEFRASVVHVAGDVRVSDGEGVESRIAAAPAELRLCSGCIVATGPDGGVNLSLEGGVSVRIAASSHVQWRGAQHARLLAGALYVDARSEASLVAPPREAGESTAAALPPLTIETAYGRVSHVGTQYVVMLAPSGLTVRVREGTVVLQAERAREVASAAEEVRIDRKGVVARTSIPTYGADWRWVETLAGDFDVTGRSVLEFLQWAARESGRPLSFASEDLRRDAAAGVLRGSTRGMTVDEALESVMATTNLAVAAGNGTLHVTAR